jgi:hypothetical protein
MLLLEIVFRTRIGTLVPAGTDTEACAYRILKLAAKTIAHVAKQTLTKVFKFLSIMSSISLLT